ncbi:uncharacterized protein LOC133175187 [Saccostrea echinata]|uniref:uncharacterized protein LOC133175187 n=1 Tax=Saccostrea echinata TaxID=191078 RepID=UPI002A830B22|nr:uncharacterized protein LOC133175187 [Saccostrea echinata]
MLSSSFQTSSVEAFQCVINQFAPKMYKFSYFGMQSRLALAALHYSENSSKDQAATREGNLQYSIVFPNTKRVTTLRRKSRRKVLMTILMFLQTLQRRGPST